MEFDLIAQFLQAAHEPFLGVATLSLVEVVASEFFVSLLCVFILFTVPSTGPWLQEYVKPARTAS